MSEDVLEQLIKDYLSYNFSISVFSWQGGEPTLAGLDFFEEVVDIEKTYGKKGQAVGNALQTNGLLIDKNWAKFLSEYKFLVGISLDGPKEVHNYYRHNSWRRVMDAIQVMKEYNVEFNILTVLTDANIKKGREIYKFFRKNGFSYLQFIPALEWDPEKQKSRPYGFEPEDYGKFLCQVFDEWKKRDAGRISVRIFDDLLSYYLGKGAPSCTFKEKCNDYMVVEYNGDIYPCDFNVYSDWKLGNLMEKSLASISNSDIRQKFSSRKMDVSEECYKCRWHPLCHGGCQMGLIYGGINHGKNYLCPSYRMFFNHSERFFRKLARDVSLSTHTNV
jgi:uncharacterized protein